MSDDPASPVPPPSPQGLKSKGFVQRLGQSFNGAGIVLFARVALTNQQLAIPHLAVPDLRCVQWAALRKAGFQGCVFDKDNTLTEPYSMELHPFAREALAECMREFGGKVVLYSNSAGLEQFDPEGEAAWL
jgi:phosphatidylglycerophosphatase GEP4